MRVERQRLVVLDANAWLSATLSPNGTPAQVVRAVLLQGLAVFSEAAFAEQETHLWKPKFDRYISLEARKAILRDSRAAAFWVAIPPELADQHWSRDPDGDVFIRTALAAQAPWLMTGAADLLSVPAIEGLSIFTLAQGLRIIA